MAFTKVNNFGSGSSTEITATTITSGANAADNTSAVTSGVIKGGTHVAGGTADQSGTLTIESPDSKGSGESKIIFKVPVPGASGTAVRATTEVMNVSYVDALASKGVEITGALDVTGTTRLGNTSNVLVNNSSLYLRGANNSVANVVMDQGVTGSNYFNFPDNFAEAFWIGEAANRYLNFISTNAAEAVELRKALRYNVINDAVNAFAGGGQASATQLVVGLNRITVVATNGDSVKLPAAAAGLMVMVCNADSSESLDLFPSSGDVINNLAANSALSVGAGKSVWCSAFDGTNWAVTTP